MPSCIRSKIVLLSEGASDTPFGEFEFSRQCFQNLTNVVEWQRSSKPKVSPKEAPARKRKIYDTSSPIIPNYVIVLIKKR